jgi:large subunit ribosomal protein L17
MVFSYLKNKYAVSELFREVSPKIAERPGGYTRILKTGSRLGDNADMCIIELVDYNENMLAAKEETKTTTRRRRRGRGKKSATEAEQVSTVEQKKKPTGTELKDETISGETVVDKDQVSEAPAAEKKEEAPAAEKKVEAPAAEKKGGTCRREERGGTCRREERGGTCTCREERGGR